MAKKNEREFLEAITNAYIYKKSGVRVDFDNADFRWLSRVLQNVKETGMTIRFRISIAMEQSSSIFK